jgi:RND family efflux transporter MFP subunit
MTPKSLPIWSVVLLASLALAGCVDRAAQEQSKKTAAIVTDQTTVVETTLAESRDVPRSLDLTGSLVTQDDVAVSSKLPGRLVTVYVQDGAAVSAGQVIAIQESGDAMARLRQARSQVDAAQSAVRQAELDARVTPTRTDAAIRASEARLRQAKANLSKLESGARPEEKRQAKANLDRAKSDLSTAEKNLERSKRLHAEGAIATAQLEADENRYQNALAGYQSALEGYNLALEAVRTEDIAQAREAVRQAEEQLRVDRANKQLDPAATERVTGARAQLEAARENVRLAQISLDDLTIRAPMSGKISGKPLQSGTMVSPGVPIARIIGADGIYFEAEVPEKEVSRIRPGLPVQAAIQALGDVALTGTVVAVNPLASNLGRLFTVRISINERLSDLKPGMFVRGKLETGVDQGVITIPDLALVTDGEDSYVFLVKQTKKDGVSGLMVERKKVVLIRRTGGLALVEGLVEGDEIVTKGQTTLVDGGMVRKESAKPTEPQPEEKTGE